MEVPDEQENTLVTAQVDQPDQITEHRLANLRDVAGMPTVDGGRTRPGVLWRSDAPLRGDTTEGLHGVAWPPGSVVDMRNDRELPEPHALVDLGSELTPLPVLDSLAPDVLARGRAGGLGQDELYLQLMEIGPAWLPTLFRVAAHGPGPLLVHCAAGKDRTGVAVATLLRAAGVERDAVFADFSETNRHRVALHARLQIQGVLPESVPAEQIGITPWHIEPVLDLLDDDPRGVLRTAGVPDADLEAWRDRLVAAA